MVFVSAGSSGKINDDGKADDPVKTRKERLRPAPPVGVDSAGGSSNENLGGGRGVFTIDIRYGSGEEDYTG
jgi:hypothetical protein